MEIKFVNEELEKLISNHLIENNHKLENYPKLVIDNGVAFVKADVDFEKNEKLNNNKIDLDAGEITADILDSGFWMAGQGHFDLTFEQIKEVIEVSINTKKQSDRINKLSSLYDQWRSE